MQFDEHISSSIRSNHMHINLKAEILEAEIGNSILSGFINIIGLNIVLARKLDYALYATCSKIKKTSGNRTNAFTEDGWRTWNREDALVKHEGGVASVHQAAQERYNLFVSPRASQIDNIMVKGNNEDLRLYKIRLTYALRCLRFLLHQGLAFRGHRENEEPSNRGNFIELLKWLATNSEEVNKYVLNNAPRNCKLTSPDIQQQIIQCCAIETRKKIIEELGTTRRHRV